MHENIFLNAKFLYKLSFGVIKHFSNVCNVNQQYTRHCPVLKKMFADFRLNNREAKGELKVYKNDRLLPFCPTLTYLGIKLDRSLTFRHHLVALRKKLSSRVTLVR